MTDRVQPGAIGSFGYSFEMASALSQFSDGWIVDGEPTVAATLSNLDETALDAFDYVDDDALTVTIAPGEGFDGGWFATDEARNVELADNETGQAVAVGWNPSSVYEETVHSDPDAADEVLVQFASEFSDDDFYQVIWEFDTDSSSVTDSTDRRRPGPHLDVEQGVVSRAPETGDEIARLADVDESVSDIQQSSDVVHDETQGGTDGNPHADSAGLDDIESHRENEVHQQAQPPEEHDNSAHSENYLTEAPESVDYQEFNSSGTWSKVADARVVYVEVVGGGGGGGAGGDFGDSGGAGGGGGGYASAILDADLLGSSVSVTVGSGGGGATSQMGDGSTGGQSSFGSIVEATGGGAGQGSQSSGTASAGTGGAGSGFTTVELSGGDGGDGAQTDNDGFDGDSAVGPAGGGGGGGYGSDTGTNGGDGGASTFGSGGPGGSNSSGNEDGGPGIAWSGAGGGAGGNSDDIDGGDGGSGDTGGGGGGGGSDFEGYGNGGNGGNGTVKVWTFKE